MDTPDSNPARNSAKQINTAGDAVVRAHQICENLTLDEHISLLHGTADDFKGWGPQLAGVIGGAPRVGIPPHVLVDGPAGVGNEARGVTQFPAPIALGATFDPEITEHFGAAIARQARGKGASGLLAPGADVTRDPRAGRTFENFGEDPMLVAEMGASVIRGIHTQPITSIAKHLAAYTQETHRNTPWSRADVDERTLHEIYLRPFYRAVEHDVSSVMTSYNRIDGVVAANHTYLIRTVLKGQMGFTGYTISDWFGAHSTIASMNAGLDVVMPEADTYGTRLREVAGREVSRERIAEAARRVVRALVERGVLDDPPPPVEQVARADVRTPADADLARKIATESMVLLRNRNNVLPIRSGDTRIAVVGSGAGRDVWAAGAGSARVIAEEIVTPLQGLATRAQRHGAQIEYADGSDLEQVRRAVHGADVVLAFGYRGSTESADRADLRLAREQERAICAAIAGHPPRAVFIANTGMPVEMVGYADVPAVLACWYPGEQYGHALADVLFGDADPGGRTPITWPRDLAQLPTASRAQFPGGRFTERLEVGYRGYATTGEEPMFAFGSGESYTTFTVGELRVEPLGDAGDMRATVRVRNAGERAGVTVVQLYAADVSNPSASPRGLVAFAKVRLDAGQGEEVELTVHAHDLAWWNVAERRAQVRAGEYAFTVGQSCVDVADEVVVRVAETVAVRAALPPAAGGMRGNGSLAEWFADARGAMPARIVGFILGMMSTLRIPMKAPQAFRAPSEAF